MTQTPHETPVDGYTIVVYGINDADPHRPRKAFLRDMEDYLAIVSMRPVSISRTVAEYLERDLECEWCTDPKRKDTERCRGCSGSFCPEHMDTHVHDTDDEPRIG